MGVIFSYALVVLLLINLFQNHSVVYFKDWKYDQCTKLAMQQLIKEHNKFPNRKIRLGINWLFEPSTNFYRYTWNLNWMNPTHRRGINKNDDYLYIFKTDNETPLLTNKKILFSDEKTDCLLIKNRD